MSFFLRNYTSDVPVSKTIFRIEQVLIQCGVSGITKEYGPGGTVAAVRFTIQLPNAPPVDVRLPVDVDHAHEALWKNYSHGETLSSDGQSISWAMGSRKRRKKKDFRQQAERTAWRIMQDWVEIQMSMIQMQQADFAEVFLPYIWDGQTTVYHRLKAGGFAALLPEKSSAA